MISKTDYINGVNSKLPSGSNIPASDHRDTMHTDANSVEKLVYSAKVGDDNTSETYTTNAGNFNYQIDIFKNANTITIYGQISPLVNASDGALTKIFDFSNSNLEGNGISYNKFVIKAQGTALYVQGGFLAGGVYDFSITYNSTN